MHGLKTVTRSEHPEPWGLHGAFTTLRKFESGHLPFRDNHLDRLLDSANRIGAKWIPSRKEVSDRLDEFLASQPESLDGLIRICLFDGLLGVSSRPALSDGNPVKGRLLEYRRPEPLAKSTAETQLYGRLSELDLATEDWILIDPEGRDLRESATSNLIFAQGSHLLIPEKFILQGIVLNQLIPFLECEFSVTRGSPKKKSFDFSMKSSFAEPAGESPLSPPFPNLNGLRATTKSIKRLDLNTRNSYNPEMSRYEFNGQAFELRYPAVMGILNLTPDSFSDGGSFFDTEAALEHALSMVEAGAQIIDLGEKAPVRAVTPYPKRKSSPGFFRSLKNFLPTNSSFP